MISLRFSISDRFGVRRVFTDYDKEMQYRVDYNYENHTFSCDCHLFETDGIVCRHGLLVFREEQVEFAPSIYILDRWSKKCKPSHLDAKTIVIKVNQRRETYNNLYSSLHSIFLDLIDYALLDEDTQKAVVDGLNGLRLAFSNSRERITESVGRSGSNEMAESASNVADVNADENEDAVKDPNKRRKRGRHPTQRLKSTAEKIRTKLAKKKKKSIGVEENISSEHH